MLPKILFYLAKWFQRRRSLEIDQPETRIQCNSDISEKDFPEGLL